MKILIVDDHPVVRMGLVTVLSRVDGFSISGEAGSVADAIREIGRCLPDLVVADMDLENGSGLDLIKELKGSHPGLPVLIISTHPEELYVERVLRAGGRGYIAKRESPDALVQCIRTVMQGKISVSEKIAAKALEVFSAKSADKNKSSLERLSDRELEVFRMMGQAIDSSRIAEILGLSKKTVGAHISHIKAKLGIVTITELRQRAFESAHRKSFN